MTPRLVIGQNLTPSLVFTPALNPGVATLYGTTTALTQVRLGHAGADTETLWDNIYLYPVTNRLFFGVKRPPHKTLAGKDASNFNLTNPA